MTPQPAPSFAEATKVWAKIGFLSFGGPAGQIALMHRMLVEERRWIGEQRFLHALNYCMLLPGPEAQQLAIYIGWLMNRTAGGLVAGVLFVLPGALVMLALSTGYVLFGATPAAAGLFLGVKAAVIAVVVEAVVRIGRRALKTQASVTIAAASFLAIFVLRTPFPLIVLAAGVIGLIGGRWAPRSFQVQPPSARVEANDRASVIDAMFAAGVPAHVRPSGRRAACVLAVWAPIWLAPMVGLWLAFGADHPWTRIAGFFTGIGAVTFGGAYAALAYVAQAAVMHFGWLQPGEMADGLGLAETTPGPLILVLQFVGFLAGYRNPGALPPLAAGSLAAVLTCWVIFAPSFLWVFLGGPYVEKLRGNRALAAALAAITAAVVGVILNLAAWFSLHTLFGAVRPAWPGGPDMPEWASLNPLAIGLAVMALVAMLRFKAGVFPTLLACAAAGLAARWLISSGPAS